MIFNVNLILLLNYNVYSEKILHATTQKPWNSGGINPFAPEQRPLKRSPKQQMARLASKHVFRQNSLEEMIMLTTF